MQIAMEANPLKTMRVAYIHSENMRPRIRAFAFPIRKRTFQPGIYCTARRAKGFENMQNEGG